MQYDNVTLESEGQEHELRKRIGTLYFGVKPNGDVCGQNVSESSLKDVSRAVYESIRPQIYPAIEEVILAGKHLIKVEFNGNNTPYSASGRYYLRTADEDQKVCNIFAFRLSKFRGRRLVLYVGFRETI